jgi:hypothetical protein
VIFWATLAIVNAIVMTTGDVDTITLLQVALEVWLLIQLRRAEKQAAR